MHLINKTCNHKKLKKLTTIIKHDSYELEKNQPHL